MTTRTMVWSGTAKWEKVAIRGAERTKEEVRKRGRRHEGGAEDLTHRGQRKERLTKEMGVVDAVRADDEVVEWPTRGHGGGKSVG